MNDTSQPVRPGPADAIVTGMPARLRLIATGRETLPPDRIAAADEAERAADAEALAQMAATQQAFRDHAWAESCPQQFRTATLADLDRDHQDQAGVISGFLDTPGMLVLLLHGRGSLGKSHAAYATGHAAVARGLWTAGWSYTDLLADLRPSSVDPGRNERIRGILRHADLLVLDDLGPEADSPFTQQVLWDVIQGRLSAGRRTVLTTNLDDAALARRYGSRIMSRLVDEVIVEFTGQPRRRNGRT